jgi:hypothetical protein
MSVMGKSIGMRTGLVIALAVVVLGVPLAIAIDRASDRGAWTYAAVGLPVLGLVVGIALLARTESASGRGRWPANRDPGGRDSGEPLNTKE